MDSDNLRVGAGARFLLVATAFVIWAFAILAATGVQRALAASQPVTAGSVRTGGAAPGLPGLIDGAEGTPSAAQQVADSSNPRNLLFTVDHVLYTSVGYYTDCTGKAALTHGTAAIDTCVGGLDYFIGHNPGVFSGLMSLHVGSTIRYYDATGHLYRLLIVADRTWLRRDGIPPPAVAGEAAQFQTCVSADGSVDRILDAVSA